MKLRPSLPQPEAALRRGPRLRAATFEDYEQITDLGARHGLQAVESSGEWRHLWTENPVYRELQGDWTIGWVLEDDEHRIVGTMGNIPLQYEFEGKTLLVASGHAWAAEPEHRSASLILLEHVVNQPGVVLYVNNTVGPTSARAVEAFGCAPVPVGRWNETAYWNADHRGIAEHALRRRHYPLAAPLSYPVSAALALKDRLAKPPVRAGDVEVTDCLAFDERFDDFWIDLKRRNPHLLLAVRTREMLEWHYKPSLSSRRLWIGTITERHRILAYATFARRERPNSHLKRVRLVDFQSLDGTPALLPPLLHWALRKCRERGIHTLESDGAWMEEGEPFEAFAPHRRHRATWSFVYRANDPALAARLTDRRVWAPTLYDSDASLLK